MALVNNGKVVALVSNEKHDVSGVIAEFLRGKCADRNDLISEITAAIRDTRQAKILISEIGHEAVSANLSPVGLISLGLMYGIVLGILMEKERIDRKRLVVC